MIIDRVRVIKRFAWLPKLMYGKLVWLKYFAIEQECFKQPDAKSRHRVKWYDLTHSEFPLH